MANMSDGWIEFLFNDKKDADKMSADFDKVMARDPDPLGEGCWGDEFMSVYFPTLMDDVDYGTCVEAKSEVKEIGGKYGFRLETESRWCEKIGLWAGICKKYYPSAEIHYREEELGAEIFTRWDPDESMGASKYHFYLEVDGDDMSKNIETPQDLLDAVNEFFDREDEENEDIWDGLDKTGAVQEIFDEINNRLKKKFGDDECFAKLYSWDEAEPCDFEFIETTSTTVKDFDFDSVPATDLTAVLYGEDKRACLDEKNKGDDWSK